MEKEANCKNACEWKKLYKTLKMRLSVKKPALNERFGTMAGVPRWIALQNSKLCGSWQVQVARHCAKPQKRCVQCRNVGGDKILKF
jgi:hypothetical protein